MSARQSTPSIERKSAISRDGTWTISRNLKGPAEKAACSGYYVGEGNSCKKILDGNCKELMIMASGRDSDV